MNALDRLQINQTEKFKEITNLAENFHEKDTKLLLSENPKHKNIAKKLGITNQDESEKNYANQYMYQHGKTISEFKDQAFHIDEIRKLCLDYDFVLGRTMNYKSSVSNELIDKIDAFCENNDLSFDNNYDGFYFLAPSENFKKVKYSHDPICLYLANTNGLNGYYNPMDDGFFIPINDVDYKTGFLRYLRGFFKKSELHHYISMYFVNFWALMLIASYYGFPLYKYTLSGNIFSTILLITLNALFALIIPTIIRRSYDFKFSMDCWFK